MTAPAATLRGGAVGAVTAALAVAAHGWAGGGYPEGSAFALLLAVSIGVGILGALPRERTRIPHTALLTTGLLAGQAGAHIALALGATHDMHDMHEGGLLPSTSMMTFHVAAAIVAACLIGAAERLYGPITSIVRAVLALLTPIPDATTPGRVRAGVSPSDWVPVYFPSAISRRGPPAASF